MSSHREAPEIAKDPVADNTDVYAFVSPDRPDTVTLIANYIPLEAPAGGPNFYEFGDDVLYEIHIDNDQDGIADISYRFRFRTIITNPDTFLYNTGPITSLGSKNWNRKQFYSVSRVNEDGYEYELASGLACPPCNIGPRSTPNYANLASAAVYYLNGGEIVFAGQRREGFYVDLGSVFDLADLRPFSNLHLIPGAVGAGVDATKDVNVHSIAIQVPIRHLTANNSLPSNPGSPLAVIGVYASASRQEVKMHGGEASKKSTGPWQQVSRLGNPLFNEVIVPMSKKDQWNEQDPSEDSQFAKYVQNPELANLLPVLYPSAFPNLAALNASKASRDDLVAILLTGLPAGIISGFQNYTGKKQADLLRLNMVIAPTTNNPSPLGLLGNDLAGFPNGRRVFDDVFTIELRAIAGLTYALVQPSYQPDGAAKAVTDGLTAAADRYISTFPYLGLPKSGFDVPSA